MVRPALHKPHRIPIGDPDEEGGLPLPVEPDEGPVPDMIPDYPEHDRVVDPED
jgi:hypothetical protein